VDGTASAFGADKKLDYRKGQRLGWQAETCCWGASRHVNAVMGAKNELSALLLGRGAARF
jgi:hypothetical protein